MSEHPELYAGPNSDGYPGDPRFYGPKPTPKPILGVRVVTFRGSRLVLSVTELGMHCDQAGGSHLLTWINAPGGGRCVAVDPTSVDAGWILSQWVVTGPKEVSVTRAEASAAAEALVMMARGEG